MSLNLYWTGRSHDEGAYRAKDFFSIERKESTENITWNNFLQILDVCFETYLQQSTTTKSKEHILWLQEVFSTHSLRQFLMKIAWEEIDQIIWDRTIPLTDQQLQELIVVWQNAIDNYGEKKKISHRNVPNWFAPLAYSLHQLIQELWIQSSYELNKGSYLAACNTIANFFRDFLANYFFVKSEAAQETEKNSTKVTDTILKSEELLHILLSVVSTITNQEKQQEYAQILFHVKENKDNTISMKDIDELCDAIYDEIEMLLADDENKQYMQERILWFIDRHFSAFRKHLTEAPLYRWEIFDKKWFFIHRDSFYFKEDDTLEVWEPLEECLWIEWFEIPRRKEGLRDMYLFNALGEKVRWGDIYLDTKVDSLGWTYYLLSEKDARFAKNEHLDKAEVFNVLWRTHKEPLKLTIDYMRYKAKYRIHWGKIEQNVTTDDI